MAARGSTAKTWLAQTAASSLSVAHSGRALRQTGRESTSSAPRTTSQHPQRMRRADGVCSRLTQHGGCDKPTDCPVADRPMLTGLSGSLSVALLCRMPAARRVRWSAWRAVGCSSASDVPAAGGSNVVPTRTGLEPSIDLERCSGAAGGTTRFRRVARNRAKATPVRRCLTGRDARVGFVAGHWSASLDSLWRDVGPQRHRARNGVGPLHKRPSGSSGRHPAHLFPRIRAVRSAAGDRRCSNISCSLGCPSCRGVPPADDKATAVCQIITRQCATARRSTDR